MIKIENRNVFSTTGALIRRKGTEMPCFHRATALSADSTDDFEEVDSEPAFTKEQYDDMVDRLVRERYSLSEELALQRKAMTAILNPQPLSDDTPADRALDEFAEYNAYVNSCKLRARDPGLYTVLNPVIKPADGEETL